MINLDYFNKDMHLMLDSMIGTVTIIVLLVLYTRIFGLKSFSKMTGVDFVLTIIIGNVSAMSLSTGRPGLFVGAIIVGFAFLLNYLLSILRFNNKNFAELTSNQAILLMRNGEIIYENLEKTKVTVAELRGKLREANVLQMSQAKAVILETTGDVSVLHSSNDIEIDEFLLEDIIN